MILHFCALILGFLLDLLLGDPHWAPHPVRLIGRLITWLEGLLRHIFPPTRRGLLAAGAALVLLVLSVSAGGTVLLFWLYAAISPWLAFALETVLSYQLLAARALQKESMKVCRALEAGNLAEGRRAVSMIVGRDTDQLSEAGVAKAAVETVAENASDGVIAPLIFLALGGPPLGMLYKAVNTMDSMVGYQNDQYRFFGRCAARLDDALNFFPARISGILMCLAAPLVGLDGKAAWKIFRRDRRNHQSPNSAHTEASAAGALHVQLAGPSCYAGKLVEKPTIGDDLRPVEPGDIRRVNQLMLAASILAMLLLCAVPLAILPLL